MGVASWQSSATNETASTIDVPTLFQLRDFFADMVFNYAAAVIVVVLFEAPEAGLDRLIYGKIIDFIGSKKPKVAEEKMKQVSVIKPEDNSAINYKL